MRCGLASPNLHSTLTLRRGCRPGLTSHRPLHSGLWTDMGLGREGQAQFLVLSSQLQTELRTQKCPTPVPTSDLLKQSAFAVDALRVPVCSHVTRVALGSSPKPKDTGMIWIGGERAERGNAWKKLPMPKCCPQQFRCSWSVAWVAGFKTRLGWVARLHARRISEAFRDQGCSLEMV